MRGNGRRWAWLVGLVLAAGAGLALAQDDGAGAPNQPRRRPEGRPGLGEPGAQRRPMGPMGADTPEIRKEMDRHMAAMRALTAKLRPQGEQIREKLRQLREQGATREEIVAALKPDPAVAAHTALALADELAIHHANLAKIISGNRKAVAKSIAEAIVRRAATRGGPGGEGVRPRQRPGDNGPPFPPRRRPDQRGGNDAGAPENF